MAGQASGQNQQRDDSAKQPAGWLATLWAVPRGRWTWIAAGYCVVFLVIQVLLGRGTPAGDLFDLLGFVPASLGATLAFLLAASAPHAAPYRRGLIGYGLSFGLTTVGTLIWLWQEHFGRIDPTYSWANIPYLLSYPAAIYGVLALPRSRSEQADGWRRILDGVIAVVAGGVITWLLVIAPMAAADDSAFHRLVNLSYPIGDLLTFAALVPVLLTPLLGYDRSLPLLVVGQSFYLLGDLGYQLNGSDLGFLGFDWPNLPYLVGYTIMIWACESIWRSPGLAPAGLRPPGDRIPRRNPVPLVLGGVVYLLLFTATIGSGPIAQRVLVVTVLIVSILLLVREGVTDRQNLRLVRALEARQAEERFLATIQGLRTGVLVQEPGGAVLLANRAALDLLGVTEPELRKRTLLDPGWGFTGEDGARLTPAAHPARLAVAGRQPVRNILMGIARANRGGPVWLLVDAQPEFGRGGEVVQVLVTLHDITERRSLEEQLRQAQRMEAVGKLAGGIAHDFNNLITAITGYASMLQDGLEPGDPRRAEVVEIEKAANRAASLTQQLLAYGRRQFLRPEVLDAGKVINDAERLLTRLLREDIEIETRIAADLGRVVVDRGQLEQVIINLTVNARDAMPRGGRLVIAARNIGAGSDLPPAGIAIASGGAVLIEVSDTGVGMDEPTRLRAFEPFFTTKEVGKGTGLGLSTVYGIVRQSGGEIWIRSEPGRGTVVSVCLPRTHERVAETPTSSSKPAVRGSETILVVEDEPAVIGVTRGLLERHGYRVLVATSAHDGRRILEARDTRIDLLLSDMVMPGESGIDLVTWARGRDPRLPVLFMTGYADEETWRQGEGLARSVPVLPKPFKPEQLVAQVRAALDGSHSAA